MEPVDQRGAEAVDLGELDIAPAGVDRQPGPRPHTLVAAVASLLLLVALYLMNNIGGDKGPDTSRASSERSEVFEVQIMGKMAVVFQAFAEDDGASGMFDDLEVRSVRGRAAKIATLYALGERLTALGELADLESLMQEHADEVTDQDTHLVEVLKTVLDQEPAQITPEQEQLLVEELGWCGQALLARKKGDRAWFHVQQQRAAGFLTGLFLIVLSFAVAFFAGIVLWVRLLYLSPLRPGYLRFDPPRLHPGFHLEAFAAVLALMIVGQAVLPAFFPEPLAGVFVTHGVALLGLLVLGRSGAKAPTWMQDVGLQLRGFLRGLIEGIKVYAIAVPPLVVGATYTFLLTRFSPEAQAPSSPLEPLPQPSHPAIDLMLEGHSLQLLLIFLTAVVGAPIVEEILFRGLLYRFVRGYTSFFPRGWSIFWSCILTAFVFAVIHPQGLVAVPALMGLAVGFAVGRERYGSLIPCMVAHALNNALVLGLVLLIALS